VQCKRCLLDNRNSNVRINTDGLCSECLRFDKAWGQSSNLVLLDKAKAKLCKLLNSYKNLHNKFDCIVASCGGTDSLFVLYLLKYEYGLNPLVVTVNNGFLNPEAKRNLEIVADKLNVKQLYIDPQLPIELYRKFLNTSASFCFLCVYAITYYLVKIAHQNKIKLIATGMSRRHDPFLPYGANYFNLSYIIKDCKKDGFRHEILDRNALTMTMFRMFNKRTIHIPDYISWNKPENIKFLEGRFSIKLSEKYDCFMSPLANYVAAKKCGLTYHFLQCNQMVRNGIINKDQALKRIVEAKESDSHKLQYCLDEFNLTEREIDIAVKNSKILDSRVTFRLGQSLRNLYLRQRWL